MTNFLFFCHRHAHIPEFMDKRIEYVVLLFLSLRLAVRPQTIGLAGDLSDRSLDILAL